MQKRKLFSSLMSLAWLTLSPNGAFAEKKTPSKSFQVHAKLTYQNTHDRFPSKTSGHVHFTVTDTPVCLFKPQGIRQKPNFLAQRLNMLTGQKTTTAHRKSSIAVKNHNGIDIGTSLVRFEQPGHYKVEFSGSVPLPLFFSEYQYVNLIDYYPRILENCTPDARPFHIATQVHLQIPDNQHIAGTHLKKHKNIYTVSSWQTQIPIALSKQPWRRLSQPTPNGMLTLWTQDPKQTISTAREALQLHSEVLGPYPFASLDIFESSGGHTLHGIEGHTLVETPRSQTLREIQSQYMNIHNWALTTLIAQQWIGASVYYKNEDDLWLFEGIIEFSTAYALSKMRSNESLWNSWQQSWNPISFSYLDIQNLGTTWLSTHVPYCQLTDTTFKSIEPHARQSPLLYLRHAVAMKHMAATSGQATFLKTLHDILKSSHQKHLTPKIFRTEVLKKLPFLQKQIDHWWLTHSWPDYQIKDIQTHKTDSNTWATTFALEDTGGFHTPVPIRISGKRFSHVTMLQTKSHHEVLTTFAPESFEVDPFYTTYDTNRFNNSNRTPELFAFPGSAKNLSDKDYTLVWFPYALRRHSEPMSIGVIASLYRYLTHGLSLYSEWQHEKKTWSGQAVYRSNILGQATRLTAHASHDHFDETLLLLLLKKALPYPHSLKPHVGVALRHRAQKQDATSHETFSLSLDTKYQKFLEMIMHAETEAALPGQPFDYIRSKASLLIQTPTLYPLQWRGSVTIGHTKYTHAPELALWSPQRSDDGGLRLDQQDLPLSDEIRTSSQEISIPFPIPLPSRALLLGGRTRLKVFYDYGESRRPRHTYSAAGLSLNLPVGGDVSGAGAISLSGLSATAVLQTRINDNVSRKPRIFGGISAKF